MSYFSVLAQNVQLPGALQSVANINSGVTWSSGYVSTLNVAGIQPNLKTDQNCILYVDQSSDGINADAGTDSFNLYANTGNGFTIQATSAYVQIRIKNIGLAATTSLVLATALCPIVEAVPRALSEEGNLKVGVYELEDLNFLKRAWVTPMNALKVTEGARLVGTVLCDPLSSSFWTQTVTGSGTITQTGGQVVLATGTTNASTTRLSTTRLARYIGSYSNHFRAQIRRPAAVGANTQRWGAFDASNGAFFSCDNVAGLSVVTRKGGADTAVATGSFNGRQGASYVVDTSVHVYEIVYNNGSVWFLIDGESLHKVSASSTTWTNTMHLPASVENNNGANLNNNSLNVRVATISRLGKESTQPTGQRINAVGTFLLKSGPGLLHALIFGDMPTAAGASITLYDNTAASGTIIANLVPRRPTTSMQPQELNFHKLTFSTGLTVVVAGSSGDITVVYE